ncbi:nuclear pore transmembrane ring protein [Malassezia pachydermatis]
MSAPRDGAKSGPRRVREERAPRIPLSMIDAPTQRFYAVVFFASVQLWKLSRIWSAYGWGSVPASRGWLDWCDPSSLFVACLLDFTLCYGLYWLAIPGRRPSMAPAASTASSARPTRPWTLWHYLAVFAVLLSMDIALLGTSETWSMWAALWPGPAAWSVGERRVRWQNTIHPQTYISGQHTIHIVPPGTARMAPASSCMCIGPSSPEVLIPILFNETVPAQITYEVQDFVSGETTEHVVKHPKTSPMTHTAPSDTQPDVPRGARAMSLAERKRARKAAKQRAKKNKKQKSQLLETVHYLRVSQQGRVRLVSVLDKNGHAAQIMSESMELVACPTAHVVAWPTDACPHDEGMAKVSMQGTPPLHLDYEWTHDGQTTSRTLTHDAPSAHNATISLNFARPGTQALRLLRIRDACGNQAKLESEVTMQVHARAQARWDASQCVPGRPLKLLRHGPPLDLRLHITPMEAQAPRNALPSQWEAHIAYAPDTNATLPTPLSSKDAWDKRVSLAPGEHRWRVTQPGTYALHGLTSTHCRGAVQAPWTCDVIDVPPPSAVIHFESINDPCAGTVGVKALSVLEGEPPFRLSYEIQRAGQAPQRHVRVVQAQTRDELEFWPNTEGAITYRFLSLDDANYRGVPLDGPTFTQHVHPMATAEFVGTQRGGKDKDLVVSSCGKADAVADVLFSGTGPYELTYAIRGAANGAVQEHTVTQDVAGRVKLPLEVPADVLQHHGRATVSLLRLRDGKGCERRLATRDLRIDVHQSKAAIAFARTHAVVHEHETAHMPLRLEGTRPWQVTYKMISDDPAQAEEGVATLHDANESLLLPGPGIYVLTSVRDAYCQGTVLAENTAEVVVRPRPHASFAGQVQTNGSVLLPPVCQSTPYQALLHTTGQPPVDVTYIHRWPGSLQGPVQVTKHSLLTTEAEVTLTLDTSVPGWHTYELVELGDAYYGRTHAASTSRLEHGVWPRPSISTVKQTKPFMACVGGVLEAGPTWQLQGTPPFVVSVVLMPTQIEGNAKPIRFTQQTRSHTLQVQMMEPIVASGRWALHVERVEDAYCVQEQPDLTVPIQVVESAGVVPATARTDYCVGERIDFILQGTSPWTVQYAFNGKMSQLTSRQAEFTRMADRPGVLEVLGAVHESNACRHTTEPLTCKIHALPSAHVSAGAHTIESLRQGGQAEIAFHLSGEPPFAFTYQRTEPVDLHMRPKVLETHTVDQWYDREYRIPTTQEGTWSVLWIQDRWCQVSLGETSGPATWPNAMA